MTFATLSGPNVTLSLSKGDHVSLSLSKRGCRMSLDKLGSDVGVLRQAQGDEKGRVC